MSALPGRKDDLMQEATPVYELRQMAWPNGQALERSKIRGLVTETFGEAEMAAPLRKGQAWK